ncbi:unnamed protein product [Adineta ricciae]|uniref:Uncharacterized protein n=1 Tax=Adineta ricciae TaxID=249248 RepID=A0A815N034_ADIRI|nr:unnamed protein product [Adineta ricciae]
MNVNPYVFLFAISFITLNCFPCPPECICKPSDTTADDFTRTIYTINCTRSQLQNNQLIFRAQSWSIIEDKIEEDDMISDYTISIDLSNSLSLNHFDNTTIQLTGFSFSMQSLSLTNQSKQFELKPNAFNSPQYQNLQILNLSSCCQHIPPDCPQLFRSLNKLEVLDLSGTDMYKTCLDTPGTVSSSLRDLILRNNHYDATTFSHTSPYFVGVRNLTGKLDLSGSRFNMSTQLKGNCLFDLFPNVAKLDLSSTEFVSTLNDVDVHLKHLLYCKMNVDKDFNGKQLRELELRQLNLEHLPDWFTNDRFPVLTRLDLSKNRISTVDLRSLSQLVHVSLAFNPIEFENINWRSNRIYESINLRSTKRNLTNDLSTDLENLFQQSTNVDYSDNAGNISYNLTKFTIGIDFSADVSLNLSRMNLYSFDIQDISRFDDLNRLDISSNSLVELNLGKQSKLTYLDCSNQYLRILNLNSENTNLLELKCSNNSLQTLENILFVQSENLRLIDLSFNQIQIISPVFTSRYLHTINLQSNLIERLPRKLFHEKLLNLYSINLSWNKINIIESQAFQSPNLQILDLTGNPLKMVEANFLFTSSLRLFFITNDTQGFIHRCAQTQANDLLLSSYLTWIEQNGTYMQNLQRIPIEKCLRPYMSRSKTKWMKFKDDYHIKHFSFYVTLFAISIGLVLGAVYLYRKKRLPFFRTFKQYRLLDRRNTNDFEQYQREDEEIIMNLDESPFHVSNRVVT